MKEVETKLGQDMAVIGEHSDYLDTGVWSVEEGSVVAPESLTLASAYGLPTRLRRLHLPSP